MQKAIAACQPVRVIFPGKEIKQSRVLFVTRAWSFLSSHIRRSLIEFANIFLNYDIVFFLMGFINRKIGFIESVFLIYPANEIYGLSYAYAWRLKKNKWVPWLVGFFIQNGKLGIKFAISANNGDFNLAENKMKLQYVAERMENLRKLFCAKYKTFAGILPGILYVRRFVSNTPEADVTREAVCQAIEIVRQKENLHPNIPVIVLGGRGFIGRRVVESLRQRKKTVYCVDIAGNNGSFCWPKELYGKPAVLVNISVNSALKEYVDLFWPKLVIVNEVYPEPSKELIGLLAKTGCKCYHISGVRALSFPSFPGGYVGGIPCCAAWQSENMQVLLKKIT